MESCGEGLYAFGTEWELMNPEEKVYFPLRIFIISSIYCHI